MSCSKDMSRREFLWDAVRTMTWGALSLTCIPALAEAAGPAGLVQLTKTRTKKLYGFLVDTTKCIGCTKCVDACKVENHVPDGNFRTWVERYVYFKDGTVQVDMHSRTAPYVFEDLPPEKAKDVVKSFFVPKLCNMCEDSPCLQVCPVGATYRTEDGFVLVDKERCIGCSYCVQACPYGMRFINKETHTADKCTWCYHRVQQGGKTACAEACPTGARLFGEISDPESEISKLLGEKRTEVLKPYLGTHPKTRYVGLAAEVV